MSDDSVDFGDFVKAIVIAAAAYAAQNAINNAMAKNAENLAGMRYTAKASDPAAIIHVGDYARTAPSTVFFESKSGAFGTVCLGNDGRIDPVIAGMWLGNDKVTIGGDGRVISVNGSGDGPYMDDPNPRVTIHTRQGLPTETAYEPITSRWGDIWTSAHRGDNTASVAYLCFAPEAKFFGQAFPFGKPDFSWAIRGVCYDWRDVSQARLMPETWKPSANNVVWLTHLEWFRWGMNWATQIAPVLDALTREADVCDELVDQVDGDPEPRWRVAGAYRDVAGEANREFVRRKILECCDGWRTLDGQRRLVIKVGRWEEPSVTLKASDIVRSDWGVDYPTATRYGRIRLYFTNPEAGFNKVQLRDWVYDPDCDNADEFYPEWCCWWRQARRLAKIRAARMAAASQGSLDLNQGGFQAWGQRRVRIAAPLDDDLGITDIYAEIPKGMEMSDIGRFSFAGMQVGPAMYAWNAATEEGLPPGAPSLSTSDPLSTPEITATSVVTDGLGKHIEIVATGDDREDLTWFYRFRIVGDTSWDERTAVSVDRDGGTVTILTIGGLPSGVTIEVEVSCRAGVGRPTAWSDTQTQAT